MFDPVNVAGTAGLTEGIKFLYAQLSELLRQRRNRRGGEAVAVEPADADRVLDAPVRDVSIPAEELDQAAPLLAALRSGLTNYAEGLTDLCDDEMAVRELAGRARALLEALYRQHLTLTGETGRLRTGTPLEQVEATTRLQRFTASGPNAVVAHTITGQVATDGGVNVGGNVHGGVHTGERRR